MPKKNKGRNYKKAKPRKAIDKKQSESIDKLKKQVKMLIDVKEPHEFYYRGQNNSNVENNINCSSLPLLYTPLHHDNLAQKVSPTITGDSNIRTGSEVYVSQIRCKLVLSDLRNSFKTRIIAIQYKDRTGIDRTVNKGTSLYGSTTELQKIMNLEQWTSQPSTRHHAALSVEAGLRPVKKRTEHKFHVLMDKIITSNCANQGPRDATYATNMFDGETRTINFNLNLKIKKLRYTLALDKTPEKGDVLIFVYNSYPLTGSWASGSTSYSSYIPVSFYSEFKVFESE